MNKSTLESIMNESEAAKFLKVPPSFLNKLRKENRGPEYTVVDLPGFNYVCYKKKDLKAFDKIRQKRTRKKNGKSKR